tara:strand:+ start:981 stop:1445 length:465 start_codon:yes stop_codon:yes gene_type:complete
MESLREKIKMSLNKNIKAKDNVAVSTLRLIIAAIKDRDIESRTQKKGDTISDEDILNLLQNMINQRKESVDIYQKAGREDLSNREKKEMTVIKSFLPEQITADDLEKLIDSSVHELSCQSIKDLGKLIKFLKEKYPGQLNMKEVANLAKKNLSS